MRSKFNSNALFTLQPKTTITALEWSRQSFSNQYHWISWFQNNYCEFIFLWISSLIIAHRHETWSSLTLFLSAMGWINPYTVTYHVTQAGRNRVKCNIFCKILCKWTILIHSVWQLSSNPRMPNCWTTFVEGLSYRHLKVLQSPLSLQQLFP